MSSKRRVEIKRKEWRGKYFKLDEDVVMMLKALSLKFKISETLVVEKLIREAYKQAFGNLSPSLAIKIYSR